MTNASAVIARIDQSGNPHFLLPNRLGTATERFERTVRDYLSREWRLDPELGLVFCLIAFDGIILRDQLQKALDSMPDVYAWGDRICLDWTCGTRLDRRLLSTWTICSLGSLPQPRPSSTSGELLGRLDEHIQVTRDPRGLIGFLSDAASWHLTNLTGPTHAHTTGVAPITPASRQCLARQEKGCPLVPPDDPDRESLNRALGAAYSSYFNAHAMDGGHSFLDEVLAAARRKNRRDAITALVDFAQRTEHVGPVTSLITAWVLDLVESGTRRVAELPWGTIGKYTRLAVKPLLTEFSGKRIDDLDTERFAAAYNRIIAGTKDSEQKPAAAALASWHDFLVRWLQVRPLKRSLHKDLPDTPVRADILWDHEMALIDEWLNSVDGTDRVLAQVRVLWTLMKNGRFRISEALSLSLSKVKIPSSNKQTLLVSIAPTKRAKLKTFSGERVLEISDSSAVATIKDWKTRRLEDELAFPEDLLFGDPHHPGEKFKIGETYATLNQMIKAATGDNSLASHVLSHTWVCKKINAAFVADDKSAEVNPYDLTASGAGHATAVSTFKYYYHAPEKLIRGEIDDALLKFIDWRHLKNSLHVGHDAFRKRLSRAEPERRADEIKALLQKSAPKLSLPRASAPFQFDDSPQRPFGEPMKAMTFKTTINVVSDLLKGLPTNVTASRSSVPEQKVDEVKSALLSELRTALKQHQWESLTSIIGTDTFSSAFQIRRIGHPKLEGLKSHLIGLQASASGVADGVNAWRKCFRSGYVSAMGPEIAPLLSFLHRAQVSAEDIVLCHSSGPGGISEDCLNSIRVLATKELGLPPEELSQAHRRGRPAAHLQIGVLRGGAWDDRDGAALSMAGFNALMLIAAVFGKTSGIGKE